MTKYDLRAPVTNMFPGGPAAWAWDNPLRENPIADRSRYVDFFQEFFNWDATLWDVTSVEDGTGAATEVINGDSLLLTTDNGASDSTFIKWKNAFFKLTSGMRAGFSIRIKTDDAEQSIIQVGLIAPDTTPIDVAEGIFFLKADGEKTVSLVHRKTSGSVETLAEDFYTIEDDRFYHMAFHFDGTKYVGGIKESEAWSDADRLAASISWTSVSLTPTAGNGTLNLTPAFGIQNGEAAAKKLYIDYLWAFYERTI